eukprot:5583135-Pleurochrysis_carterae.AAC.1
MACGDTTERFEKQGQDSAKDSSETFAEDSEVAAVKLVDAVLGAKHTSKERTRAVMSKKRVRVHGICAGLRSLRRFIWWRGSACLRKHARMRVSCTCSYKAIAAQEHGCRRAYQRRGRRYGAGAGEVQRAV